MKNNENKTRMCNTINCPGKGERCYEGEKRT